MDAGWLRPSHTVPPSCSHRSAAALWGIHASDGATTHITLPSKNARARPGIEVHRSATITDADFAPWTASPAPAWRGRSSSSPTKPPAARSSAPSTDPRCFVCSIWPPSMLLSAGRRRGAGLLEPSWPTTPVQFSPKKESRSASSHSAARQGWPTPRPTFGSPSQKAARTRRISCGEKSGSSWKPTAATLTPRAQRFERDRLRDQRLTLAGFTMVRFTWRQVPREPDRVLRTTQDLLARLARP